MRHFNSGFWMWLALTAVPLAQASAQSDSAPGEKPAAVCAVEGTSSRDETIGVCGLVINSEAAPVPDRLHALVVRAELHRKNGHNDLALADCNEAVRLDPGPAAFDCRGNALAADRKYLPALD